jgi:hypothetical protein
MSTERQIEANRLNGSLSSGPTTPAGKAVASQNSLKHGLLSREVLLPGEDEEEFATFGRGLWQELDSQGALEYALVACL